MLRKEDAHALDDRLYIEKQGAIMTTLICTTT
jgi:hypothetical protein